MSSSPSVADRGPIDLEHLGQSTLGNASLAREVLGLFADQAARVQRQLAAVPPHAGALAHTLKGSARAIGAFAVADAAAALELAIREGRAPTRALADLDTAVKAARAAVEAILR
ncbi:Hpt domain-containing protein [Bradyrhizobium sp.]|uniref:Hpt domain-containing protein n=1 Tax=Bradyrhizobium sp. TaxID=376 RepID=UPI001ED46FC6|nr:Hpt domain-containing protein [Bradyrhizobium sp.]MBV8922825.1 Hpt domain-containing protein [Bradyrhizobium sp.]MBV9981638.1 Hpt domain-containing protein [Bradyrhizobium sp.]